MTRLVLITVLVLGTLFLGMPSMTAQTIQDPPTSIVRPDPLIEAIRTNETGTLGELIRNGAVLNPQAIDRTAPLNVAIRFSSLETVEMLVNAGARIDIRWVLPRSEVSYQQMTPLRWSIVSGRYELVQYFLSKGCDPNEVYENQLTPLHVAAERSPEMIELLLKANADVTRLDIQGRTALSVYAANSMDNPKGIELLLDAGADINHRDATRMTPLGWASILLHNQKADLLVARGGKE
ncbi:MAG: ankyrin repeat domain-containing protein [Acidobacteria bacterium]|nr:ankyrin repeat domain-containing protein [Acidobacteriota bacterium]